MSRLAELVAAGGAQEGVDLGELTTYKFGGRARWFVSAEGSADLATAIEAAVTDEVPFLILGRGSNLVISDRGFDGLVVRLGGSLATMAINENGVVSAGAAMALPMLARACAKANRGGLEFLVAVPGSVGGAVRMNAGCHGSDTAEWLLEVEVYRPSVGVMVVQRSEMEMAYRHNSLPADDVILGARLRTVERPRAESEELMRAITQWRKENQPGGTHNAGSVFKNPVSVAAGWLIDSIGLKGHRVGGARVSPRHANFFEAAPGTKAQDIYDLVREVQLRVERETGVVLEPEIRFAGDFARSVDGSADQEIDDQSKSAQEGEHT